MRIWLRLAREKAGLTQQELGDMVGRDITTIGKYENGKRQPTVTTAKDIANVLNFNWTLFFEDSENAS